MIPKLCWCDLVQSWVSPFWNTSTVLLVHFKHGCFLCKFGFLLPLSTLSRTLCSLVHPGIASGYELRFLPLEKRERSKHQSLETGVVSTTKVKVVQTSFSKTSLLHPGVSKGFPEEMMLRPGLEAKRVIITNETRCSQTANWAAYLSP